MSKRAAVELPEWFRLENYREAEKLDAAGWLLNVLFRRWLAATRADWAEDLIRRAPVLSRFDLVHRDELRMALTFGMQPMPPTRGTFLDLLRDPPTVRSGINPLTVEELYFWERMLSEELRAMGREAAERTHRMEGDPPAFFGRLDHAFTPQYLSRFVRVDLTQPDSVLVEDLRQFLKSERAELAKLPGPQPFRDSVARAGKKKATDLATLAKIGLLPYLDLRRWDLREWASSERPLMTNYAMSKAIGIEPKGIKETEKYAGLVFDDMACRAWLGAMVRGIRPRSKRRGPA